MALHRDIHWIGRQWAVTGYGMQLIDQKLKGFFDIEAVNLWDDGLVEAMHAKDWLNKADFDKGLAIARARYPGSRGDPGCRGDPGSQGNVAQPLEAAVSPAPANGRIAPMPQAPKPAQLKPEEPKLPDPVVTVPKPAETRKPDPVRLEPVPAEPPKPAIARFHVPLAARNSCAPGASGSGDKAGGWPVCLCGGSAIRRPCRAKTCKK